MCYFKPNEAALTLIKSNAPSFVSQRAHTFLLVLVNVHLSLLLEAECVDDCDGQSQGFSGVTVGTQGVDTSAGGRYVVCLMG